MADGRPFVHARSERAPADDAPPDPVSPAQR